MIAQHADNDLEFQKQVLVLLREAVKSGKAPASEQAYLEDRVLVNQGQPQIYGTQVVKKDGELVLKPVRDRATLDERRKSVGLDPIEEYLRQFP